MAIEIVSFPIQNGGSFHSYVTLEGKPPFSHGFPMVFLWFSHGFPIEIAAALAPRHRQSIRAALSR